MSQIGQWVVYIQSLPAYEEGYKNPGAEVNPYRAGTDEHTAYNFGISNWWADNKERNEE